MSKYSSYSFALIGATAALVASPTGAYAANYLSVREAQQVLFPSASDFQKLEISLSTDILEQIEEESGADFESTDIRVWKAIGKDGELGFVIFDDVWGKHEYITYALAISNTGEVLGVEITDYRETHGMEVTDPEWRKNFIGQSSANKDKVELRESIPNISGATMSCRHVTDGVRRNLTLFEKVLKNHKNA